METVKEKVNPLSGKLRVVAAILILLSGAVFLLQDYYNADSTIRLIYFMLLNFAVMGTGVACAAVLKEPKGARAGLGVGLALLPMYILQVGAVVFATFGINLLTKYPQFLHFQALPSATHTALIAVSLGGFAFLSWFAFRCLTTGPALLFSAAYIAGNAALLIPVRGSLIITTLLCVIQVALLYYLERKSFSKNVALSTPEGHYARGILFLPVVLLVIREACLYSYGYLMTGLAFGLVSFIVAHIIAPQKENREAYMSANSILVSAAIYCFAKGIIENFPVLEEFTPLMVYGLIGAYQYRVGLLSKTYQKRHFNIGSILISIGCLGELINYDTPAVSAVMLVLGILLGVLGNSLKNRMALGGGIVISTIAAINIITLIYNYAAVSTWMIFGVSGILILLASSYIEKNSARLQAKLGQIIHEWN